MGFLTGKKLLLLGFITILLAGIPLTIYLLQRQQEIRGRAAPATILSLEPATKKDVVPGTEFNLDVMLDPNNTNQVLSATIHIAYDKTKLATASPGFQPVVANLESQGLDRLAGKVEYEPLGNIIAVLNASDKTKVVKQKTKIATVTFKALEGASGTTTVAFGDQSVATAFDPEDVDVLTSKLPAIITFAGGVTPTSSPSPTPGPTLAVTPTPTRVPSPTNQPSPSPTSPVGSPTATLTPLSTNTPTPTIPIPPVSPGPGDKIMGIVGVSVILSIIGALLFFAL